MDSVAENLSRVRGDISAVCRSCGRDVGDITLIGVSKTVSCDDILLAYEAGLMTFGESKAQEYRDKQRTVPSDIEWHFIGHLQTNKVKFVVPTVSLIHSVDSVRLLSEIEKQSQKIDRHVGVLLQVNMSGELSKFGVDPDHVPALIESALSFQNVTVKGFMTIGPFINCEKKIRAVFRGLRELRDVMQVQYPSLCFDVLSMGMTADYQVAIEEGATHVRIGSAIFGERAYEKRR